MGLKNYFKGNFFQGRKILPMLLCAFLVAFTLQTCQQPEEEFAINSETQKSAVTDQNSVINYFEIEKFERGTGTPAVVKKLIGSEDLVHFEPEFSLHLKNGDENKNLVSSAIVKVDGKEVFGVSDFSQKVTTLSKSISGLTKTSMLEVEVRGIPGSYIEVWIDGKLLPGHMKITPEGGIFNLLNGEVEIDVQKGTFNKDQFISIKDVSGKSDSWSIPEPYFAYEFLPSGIIFNHPIKITCKLKNHQRDIPPVVFGPLNIDNGWASLVVSEYNQLTSSVTFELNHFSIYLSSTLFVNGLIPKPYSYFIVDEPNNKNFYCDQSCIRKIVSDEVHRGFKRWEAYTKASGITFSETQSVDDASFLIEFLTIEEANNRFSVPYGFITGVLDENTYAKTGINVLTGKRYILLNEFKKWTNTNISTAAKFNFGLSVVGIESAIAHEVGHHFGLVHYNDQPNVLHNDFPESVKPYSISKRVLFALSLNYTWIDKNFSYAFKMGAENYLTSGFVGQTIMNPIKLRITDMNNNGVPGVTVIFGSTIPGSDNYLDLATVQSDNSGYVILDKIQLPSKPMTIRVEAYSYMEEISNGNNERYLSFDIVVKSKDGDSFTDSRDGKTYKTVKIGDQVWMAENLAFLPSVSTSTQNSETEPGYHVYGYGGTDVDEAKATDNYKTYGVLYNWPAAMAACPEGWHLPSDAEWKQLEMALGMTQDQADDNGPRGTDQGTQMKATNGWASDGNGTNTSGFSALPGGHRVHYNGTFYSGGLWGHWWSSSAYDSSSATPRALSSNDGYVYIYSVSRAWGFSVRCVRD